MAATMTSLKAFSGFRTQGEGGRLLQCGINIGTWLGSAPLRREGAATASHRPAPPPPPPLSCRQHAGAAEDVALPGLLAGLAAGSGQRQVRSAARLPRALGRLWLAPPAWRHLRSCLLLPLAAP